MTSKQFSEWEAYDTLDPIGTWRDDFRIAHLESVIMNIVNSIYSEKGKKPELAQPIDFLPDWSGERKELKEAKVYKQSTEEMKRILGGIVQQSKKDAVLKNRLSKPPIKKQ